MKKMFMAVIALMMTISASAQFYIYFSDGTVVKVDSISMVAPGELEHPAPSAGIGMFSVSADKQVTFSKGNLQYTQSTNTWAFAENQWDYIGTDNVTGGSVTSDQYGDAKSGDALADKVDLFGWSTSATYFGVSTLNKDNNYSGSFVDWGTNRIGNDAPNTWRTLTDEEWYYLLNIRPNASSLCGAAQINGVKGLLLLPDGWPVGIIPNQTFIADQWSKLEALGAVFLPAGGYRWEKDIDGVQFSGTYWSSVGSMNSEGYYGQCIGFQPTLFSSSEESLHEVARYGGRSVRLVKDLQ